MAGIEVYKAGRPANNESFEVQEWGSGGILGGESRINKRRSVSETFEGCEKKGPSRARRNVEKDN